MRFQRLMSLVFVVFSVVFTLGARCVENTSVRVDSDSYTHVYGEMYNDTDISGYNMVLGARLLAGDGSVIAEQTGALCPPSLTPHQQTVFDIRFNTPNLPSAASFDVRPIAGQASDTALPNPNIQLLSANASRQSGEPVLRMDLKNNSDVEYFYLNGCVAGYDATGRVVSARVLPLQNYNDQGTPIAGGLGSKPDYALLRLRPAPGDVVALRGWIWVATDSSNAAEAYRPVITDLMPLAP